MVAAKPFDEARHADIDRGGRMKAEVALDSGNIGEGILDVARLHRLEVAQRGTAAGLLDQLDHMAQLFGAMIADVVDAVWRAAAAGLFLAIVGRRIVEA